MTFDTGALHQKLLRKCNFTNTDLSQTLNYFAAITGHSHIWHAVVLLKSDEEDFHQQDVQRTYNVTLQQQQNVLQSAQYFPTTTPPAKFNHIQNFNTFS
jgi:competence protein ComGF